jgi:hypothetical protein|tara:strand:+ start:662 stop:1093 length:432 start_codon:yes stop_codon:yes gene_type:complete
MKIELKVMDDGFVNRYDPNSHRNYACVEYSAMGAIWLHNSGKQPVFGVSMSNHDKSWGHTVCVVPDLGTYDFHANIFFPDYFWHKRPVNEEDLSKITTAIAWDDNQKLHFIDIYYRYDTNTYAHRYVWTINTVYSTQEGLVLP